MERSSVVKCYILIPYILLFHRKHHRKSILIYDDKFFFHMRATFKKSFLAAANQYWISSASSFIASLVAYVFYRSVYHILYRSLWNFFFVIQFFFFPGIRRSVSFDRHRFFSCGSYTCTVVPPNPLSKFSNTLCAPYIANSRRRTLVSIRARSLVRTFR